MYELQKNGVEWYSDFEILFFFEADIDYLQSQLPSGLIAMESRPGLGMLALGVISFLPGNLDGKLPSFNEVTFQILVAKDFSVKFPPPRFSLFVPQIGSDNAEFLKVAAEVDKMPTYDELVKIKIDKNKYAAEVSNRHGKIFSFATSPKAPSFEKSKLYVQTFTKKEGHIYFVPMSWEGEMYEHQEADNIRFEIYDHPFFVGFDVSKIEPRCFMAGISNSYTIQTFYENFEYKSELIAK